MAARANARNRRARTPKAADKALSGKVESKDVSTASGAPKIKLSLNLHGKESENKDNDDTEGGESDKNGKKDEENEKSETAMPDSGKTDADEGPKVVEGDEKTIKPANPGDSPAETLMSILQLLGLIYDKSTGVLSGKAVLKVPETSTLEQSAKLLDTLVNQLDSGIESDRITIKKYRSLGFESQITEMETKMRAEKASASESTADKSHEPGSPTSDSIVVKKESDSEPNRKRKAESGKYVPSKADEEDDEAGPPLKHHRRRSIIVTANGKRREIKRAIADVDESDEDDISVEGDVEVKQVQPATVGSAGPFLPSVYAGKPKPNFDIPAMLKPTVAELQLYDDAAAKASSSDEREYMKKKLAVADYPESTLKDYLPGEIPTKDLSVNRPSNQTAFTTFENYVQPFFRNFTEEDLSFLHQESVLGAGSHVSGSRVVRSSVLAYEDKQAPYEIPPLGPLYSDVWQEEDAERDGNLDYGRDIESGGENGTEQHFLEKARKKAENVMEARMQDMCEGVGSEEKLNNESLAGESRISCGPLTSRLLSAVVGEEAFVRKQEEERENGVYPHGAEDEDGGRDEDESIPDGVACELPGDEKTVVSNDAHPDYKLLDDRLKRELKYIGVYMNVQQILKDPTFEQDWSKKKEDDEVCRELRSLQTQLKAVQKRNNRRKKVLIPIVEEQIAWQEYMSVLEDLNKQVEQHYRRRINVNPRKSRRRGGHHREKDRKRSHSTSVGSDKTNSGTPTSHLVTSASFEGLLAKRAKWIEKIGPLFKSERDMRRMPEESIFKNLDEANDDEDEDEGDEGEDEDEDDVLAQARRNANEQVQTTSLEMDKK